MFPLHYKFLWLSYFEKLRGTGRTDRQTDMQQLMQPLREDHIQVNWPYGSRP